MIDKNKKARETALEHDRVLAAVKKVFDSSQGRLVGHLLLAESKMLQDVFQPSSINAFDQGKQYMGHFLFDLVAEADPKLARDILTLGLESRVAEIKAEREKQLKGESK